MPEKSLFSKEGKLNKEIFIWHSLCNIQQIESGMEKKVEWEGRLSYFSLMGVINSSAGFFQNRTILVYFHLQGFFYNTTKKEKI